MTEIVGTKLSDLEIPLNTAMVLLLSQLLGWHFIRYSRVMSNRRKFARVLVFVAVTTLLVISVVKTSLALSLGLVGALSVIRFRTPVKETEELAYIFLAIAVGIGIGANQHAITLTIFFTLTVYMAVVGVRRKGSPSERSIVQVSLTAVDGAGDTELDKIRETLKAIPVTADLRQVSRHDGDFNATLLVEIGNASVISKVLSGLNTALPGASVSVVDNESFE